MSRCWKCRRAGLTVQTGKSGLCISCIEEAADGAIALIKELRKGGAARKKALDLIDEQVAGKMVDRASAAISRSNLSCWPSRTHATAAQLERIRRSSSVKIVNYDATTNTATVQGSGKEPYQTSFSFCNCSDFKIRQLPCKHIYALAAQCGGINLLDYLED